MRWCALVFFLLASVRSYRRKADDRSDKHSGQTLASKASGAYGAFEDENKNESYLMREVLDEIFNGPVYPWNNTNMSDECAAKVKGSSMCKHIEDLSSTDQDAFRIHFFDCSSSLGMLYLNDQLSFEKPSECTDSAKDRRGAPLSHVCCTKKNELHECCKATTFGVIVFVIVMLIFSLICCGFCCCCCCGFLQMIL
eukprot:TRINITY_DN22181_c0_g1_i1.p1 TRINITY_DN22181_c0_g1~~TRINITY_DN22181_c0_g1_i1.p1  ORF type:complete len:196 (+),score=26.14 TRINITY_DN22181_c0_g1_i1:42-629(+)